MAGEERQDVADAVKAWGTQAGSSYDKVQYFSLKDGETASLRALDLTPYSLFRVSIEVNGKRYPVSVAKEDNQTVTAAGHKIEHKNVVNVIDRRDGQVKVWEFSNENGVKIADMMKSWKKLPTEFDLAVTRHGLKLKTRYSVNIDPNMTPLTEAELALKKVSLAEYYAPNKERLAALLAGQEPPKRQETQEEDDDTGEPTLVAETLNPLDTDADVV